MDTGTKTLLINSADRATGTTQRFTLQLSEPISEVKHIMLSNASIQRDASMNDYLLINLSISTGSLITTSDFRSTFYVNVRNGDATHIIFNYKDTIPQISNACVVNAHEITIAVYNEDGSIPTIAEWNMVLAMD